MVTERCVNKLKVVKNIRENKNLRNILADDRGCREYNLQGVTHGTCVTYIIL